MRFSANMAITVTLMCCLACFSPRQFEILSESGEKVGEPSKAIAAQLAAMQSQKEDTSCGFAEEGQLEGELEGLEVEGGVQLLPTAPAGRDAKV